MKPFSSIAGSRTYLAAAALLFAIGVVAVAEDGAPWTVASQTADLTVYERVHKGSNLREFKAVGTFACPPEVVKRVLDDVEEYPKFMPYVKESRVISHDSGSRVSYQRISPPLIGDRDYTIRVKFETRHMPDGICFCNRWQVANDLGPAEKSGCTRVNITEGSWLLEPLPGGRQTRGTYSIFSDSGGALPAYIVNLGSRTAIPKVFESIRKQIQLDKYQRAK